MKTSRNGGNGKALGNRPGQLKLGNRRLLLGLLRQAGEVTVNELVEQSGLSRPVVMRTMQDFELTGVAEMCGKGGSGNGGGKRPMLFRFNAASGQVFVVHIFADELYGALTDLSGKILHSASISLLSTINGEDLVKKIVRCCQELQQRAGSGLARLIGIGIGAHGITDCHAGRVLYSPHFPNWGDNFPIKEILQRELGGSVPIYVDNQIRFLAYAEMAAGKTGKMVLIDAADGVVAGFIQGGQMVYGKHYLAGEIGHLPVDPYSEESCYCGGKGCFETKVAPERLVERFRQGLVEAGDERSGLWTVERIIAAAGNGDKAAMLALDEVARWFGVVMAHLVLTFDPELILIHGPYAEAGQPFLTAVEQHSRRYPLLKLSPDLKIRLSSFGKNGGIIGAARYVLDRHFTDSCV